MTKWDAVTGLTYKHSTGWRVKVSERLHHFSFSLRRHHSWLTAASTELALMQLVKLHVRIFTLRKSNSTHTDSWKKHTCSSHVCLWNSKNKKWRERSAKHGFGQLCPSPPSHCSVSLLIHSQLVLCLTPFSCHCQLSLLAVARSQSSLTSGPFAPGSNWQPDLLRQTDSITCTLRERTNLYERPINIIRKINVIPIWFTVIRPCHRGWCNQFMTTI